MRVLLFIVVDVYYLVMCGVDCLLVLSIILI